MKNKAFIIATSVVLASIIGISAFLTVTYIGTKNKESGIYQIVSSIKNNNKDEKPKDNADEFEIIKEDDIEKPCETATDENGNIIQVESTVPGADKQKPGNAAPVVSPTETELEKHFRKWASNGSSKLNLSYVQNGLLVCKDSTGNRKTDAILLLSANESKSKIIITPLLESSYTHYVSQKENRYDTYGAILYNEGISVLETAIENNYKINIGYNVVYQMEGVADIINGYNGITVEGKSFDGTKALEYLRDSTITPGERAKRQGNVIYALIKKLQTAPSNESAAVGSKAMKYYKSSNSNLSLVNLVKRMSKSQKNYYTYSVHLNLMTSPTYCRQAPAKVATFSNSSPVYIIDYVIGARDLQNVIYGTSIVEPSANHKHPIKLVK